MTIKLINRLIGFGIVVFLMGVFLGFNWIKHLQLLIPVGSLMTFCGVFFFFKYTNLTEQFHKDPDEDALTYFWDVVILKLWTFGFILWMIVMNVSLLSDGLQ